MILFVASATGGHIYPAIACAQELETHQVKSWFLSTESPVGSQIVRRYGFECGTIAPFHKQKWRAVQAFWQAFRYLRRLKPAVVVLCGGYLSVPVGMMAKILGVPIVILEQNVIPGRANRLLSRFATTFCSSFEETQGYLAKTCTLTGNPVRRSFLVDDLSTQLAAEPWSETPYLGVLGGSQGAKAINQWVITHLANFRAAKVPLFHIVGARDYDEMVQEQDPEGLHIKEGYAVRYDRQGFVEQIFVSYFEKMDFFYERCAQVLCRAGASTVAELLHFGIYGILVPYPFATDRHQDLNATAFLRVGHGHVLAEPDLEFATVISKKDRPKTLDQTTDTARQRVCKLLLT